MKKQLVYTSIIFLCILFTSYVNSMAQEIFYWDQYSYFPSPSAASPSWLYPPTDNDYDYIDTNQIKTTWLIFDPFMWQYDPQYFNLPDNSQYFKPNPSPTPHHTHDASDITSGIVPEKMIDGAITRDHEIMPIIRNNDGPGSRLDADMLDGHHADDFAQIPHTHNASDITAGTMPEKMIDDAIARDNEIISTILSKDGPGSGLDADTLDGQHADYFLKKESYDKNEDGYIDFAENAKSLGGLEADKFARISHTHNVSELEPGIIPEEIIDDAIARDDEIISIIFNNNSLGTMGLDADTLDGHHADAFAQITHTHNASDISSGTVPEEIIDYAIARDKEIIPTILDNDGPGSGLDADTVDGQHADDFAIRDHDHDPDYVNRTGDTMAGTLKLPDDGLAVGNSQLTVSGGNVGIGTSGPKDTLDVNGGIAIKGSPVINSSGEWVGTPHCGCNPTLDVRLEEANFSIEPESKEEKSVGPCPSGYSAISGQWIVEDETSYAVPVTIEKSYGDPNSESWHILVNNPNINKISLWLAVTCIGIKQ
ncbi:MAG: hypothetical protein ACMUJM_20540 [bacterium]